MQWKTQQDSESGVQGNYETQITIKKKQENLANPCFYLFNLDKQI